MKPNLLSQFIHNTYQQLLKHSKYRWVVILGTLFYLFSPLDISPDVFPVLGWVDDGIIVSLLMTEVSQLMAQQLKTQRDRKSTSAQANTTQVADTSATSDTVIDVQAVTVG
jgi:uncharacterized membrane protein YkvA (DUF1232 family)